MTPSTLRGHPRDVVVTVTWAVLTLGLWGAWYMFIAFREVDHQNGRRHSPLWFLGFVPIVGIAFALLYLRRELRLLHADHRRLGLVPRASFRTVALWATLGALVLVGPAVALAMVAREVNAYWHVVYQRHGVAWPLESLGTRPAGD